MTHPPATTESILKIAFLHLAPIPGEIAANRILIERAIRTAAGRGAAWILTPECGVCGYSFADRIGTDWILPQPDPWMTAMLAMAGRLKTTVFLSHPERDERTGLLYNSLFILGPDGAILGRHRKINALKIGSESWSSPGDKAEPVVIPPVGPIGLLICADAYTPGIRASLKDKGARLLVSAAAWAPGFHGPEGVWEACTRDTGLPLLVCNRTGADRILDFTPSDSVIARDGQRLYAFHSDRSAVVVFDWDLKTQTLASPQPRVVTP
jgi:predicted amidohydrolase